MNTKAWEEKLRSALKGYIESVGRPVVGSNWSGPAFSFDLPIRVEPDDDPHQFRIETALLDIVRTAFKEAALRAAGFLPGHVYCYFCQNNGCRHSTPPAETSVFSGYQANGIPAWSDFQTLLIESSHERLDTVFQEHPSLIAVFQRGRDLKQKLLSDFGKASKTYDILGQVSFGRLSIRNRHAGIDLSLGVTLQAVESRSPDRRFQLDLNILSGTPPGTNLLDLLIEHGHERLYEVILRGKRRIKELEGLIRNGIQQGNMKARPEFLREIPGIMQTLARTIEGISRQSGRRTRHANERLRDNRPVPAAVSDLMGASDEDFYVDLRRSVMIVRGPHQRVHVFSMDGTHITSLKLKPIDILRRVRTERWRKADRDEIGRFREASGHSVKTEPNPDGS